MVVTGDTDAVQKQLDRLKALGYSIVDTEQSPPDEPILFSKSA